MANLRPTTGRGAKPIFSSSVGGVGEALQSAKGDMNMSEANPVQPPIHFLEFPVNPEPDTFVGSLSSERTEVSDFQQHSPTPPRSLNSTNETTFRLKPRHIVKCTPSPRGRKRTAQSISCPMSPGLDAALNFQGMCLTSPGQIASSPISFSGNSFSKVAASPTRTESCFRLRSDSLESCSAKTAPLTVMIRQGHDLVSTKATEPSTPGSTRPPRHCHHYQGTTKLATTPLTQKQSRDLLDSPLIQNSRMNTILSQRQHHPFDAFESPRESMQESPRTPVSSRLPKVTLTPRSSKRSHCSSSHDSPRTPLSNRLPRISLTPRSSRRSNDGLPSFPSPADSLISAPRMLTSSQGMRGVPDSTYNHSVGMSVDEVERKPPSQRAYIPTPEWIVPGPPSSRSQLSQGSKEGVNLLAKAHSVLMPPAMPQSASMELMHGDLETESLSDDDNDDFFLAIPSTIAEEKKSQRANTLRHGKVPKIRRKACSNQSVASFHHSMASLASTSNTSLQGMGFALSTNSLRDLDPPSSDSGLQAKAMSLGHEEPSSRHAGGINNDDSDNVGSDENKKLPPASRDLITPPLQQQGQARFPPPLPTPCDQFFRTRNTSLGSTPNSDVSGNSFALQV